MDASGSSKDECQHQWTQDAGSSTGSVGHGPCSSTLSTASSSACYLCGYESARQSNVIRHMKTMHETTQSQDFQCCDTIFPDKAEYRDHCRQVHREGHQCQICQRRFTRRALLRRHQSVHTGFKEFSCPACTYASSHKSNLERHFKTHGSDFPLSLGNKPRTNRKRKNPQPDSTTSSSTGNLESLGYQFPILRNILKVNSSPPSRTKVQPKLSHSIESILNRKEVGHRGEQSEASSTSKDEPKSNEVCLPSIINHSLSSPFTWTLPFGQQQQGPLKSQGPPAFLQGPLRSQRPPALLPSQDLRIYGRSDWLEVPQIWWNPFFTPQQHLVSTTNYSYPNYTNNTDKGPPV